MRRNASSAYREQLGVNWQPASGPKAIAGDSVQRYTRTTRIKMLNRIHVLVFLFRVRAFAALRPR
jgi:hypothetical protein